MVDALGKQYDAPAIYDGLAIFSSHFSIILSFRIPGLAPEGGGEYSASLPSAKKAISATSRYETQASVN